MGCKWRAYVYTLLKGSMRLNIRPCLKKNNLVASRSRGRGRCSSYGLSTLSPETLCLASFGLRLSCETPFLLSSDSRMPSPHEADCPNRDGARGEGRCRA